MVSTLVLGSSEKRNQLNLKDISMADVIITETYSIASGWTIYLLEFAVPVPPHRNAAQPCIMWTSCRAHIYLDRSWTIHNFLVEKTLRICLKRASRIHTFRYKFRFRFGYTRCVDSCHTVNCHILVQSHWMPILTVMFIVYILLTNT